MRNQILPPGKLPPRILDRLLRKYAGDGDRVVVGAQVGEDAAAIEFGDSLLVAKTDPITFVTEEIGKYAININANDIACMGARPKWFLAALLLPEGETTEALVDSILSSISSACDELGISLCGGHTEISPGLTKPIVVGQMLGEVEKEKLVRSSGARIGDDILLVKGIAIEGTSIIAREKGEEVRRKFGEEFLETVRNYLYNPGISVVKEALLAAEKVEVHSMHDPTEGGLSMGLYELGWASRMGMVIYGDKVPILPECRTLGQEFGLNPLGLIASGALIVTLAPEFTGKLSSLYEKEGISSSVIGKVVARKEGMKMADGKGRKTDLAYFEQDEITKIVTQIKTTEGTENTDKFKKHNADSICKGKMRK